MRELKVSLQILARKLVNVFLSNSVDGPIYNAGRFEGRADMCAKLRTILDTEDKNHWNQDGLLKEVCRLKKYYDRS